MGIRPTDLCWEALVQETNAHPDLERGTLNAALKAIRQAAEYEGLAPDSIPDEIHLRAQAYRDCKTLGDCLLTPMALAKHWFRVVAQQANAKQSVEQQTIARLRAL